MTSQILPCPRCAVPLTDFRHERLRTAMCPTCRGLFFRREDLLNAEPSILRLVQEAPQTDGEQLPSPLDQTPMESRLLQLDQAAVVIDCCPDGSGIWLDRGELATIRRAVRRRKRSPAARPAARPDPATPETRAQKVLDAETRRLNTNSDYDVAKTGTGWFFFAILTELPVEGYNPVYRTPLVTYALMAACVLAFVSQVMGEPLALAMVPDTLWQRPYTLVTSMFLHADIFHLAVNLYFLKICGDNVEDRLGPKWYLLLFLGAGLLGGLMHALLTANSGLPMLGASGAVSGILAAYVWFFPDVRLGLLPLWWFFLRGRHWIHLRAMFYVPIWFMIQVTMLAFGVQGIAVWAHIGGFLAGLAMTWWMATHTPDARIAHLAGRIAAGEPVSGS